MVNRKEYIVQDGQNIYDVCVNVYGSVDALPKLFELNSDLDLNGLFVGQILYYIPEVVNANVLKVYSESNYIPATASEMLPSPPPAPAPPADGVVITQFGLPDVTIIAPGEFEVAPSRVEDGSGNIIQTLSPGEVYIDAPQSVTINMHGMQSVIITAPGSYNVAPSTVKKNGVLVDTLGPGEEYIVPVESVSILFPNTTEIVVQAPGQYLVEPSKVVDPLGQVIAELSPGEEYEVTVGTGIMYQRVCPNNTASYRVGDIGWHLSNGTFNYNNDPTQFAYKQELDFTQGALSFYRLKHPNAFNNKFRFTTSTGVPASNGQASFVLADFNGAINGYVIDHLTGLGYDVLTNTNFGGNWNGAIDFGVSSTFGGFTDWYMIGIEHFLSVINMNGNPYGNANLFRYADLEGNPGLNYGFMWLATTPAGLTGSAFICRHTSMAFEAAVKTGLTFAGAIYARNHY
jgi:hypothetical protein